MIKINVIVNNKDWHHHFKNPGNYIDRKIKRVNSKDKNFLKKKIYCTLLLSGDKEIKKLNKKFRKKNRTTDVLSFPFYSKKELKKKLKLEREIYIGDIIINLNKIKIKNKLKKFKTEFDFLWVHGFVHLFGYDHKRKNDYIKMNKVEKKYLSLINA
tara:strand:+ start:232 stop:699 length:468 start_codon:yes stop_codon:yes gene_type:complete